MKEKKFNECGCFQGSNEAALGMFKNRQADKTTLKSSNAFASDLIFSLKKILSPIDQKTEDKYLLHIFQTVPHSVFSKCSRMD